MPGVVRVKISFDALNSYITKVRLFSSSDQQYFNHAINNVQLTTIK